MNKPKIYEELEEKLDKDGGTVQGVLTVDNTSGEDLDRYAPLRIVNNALDVDNPAQSSEFAGLDLRGKDGRRLAYIGVWQPPNVSPRLLLQLQEGVEIVNLPDCDLEINTKVGADGRSHSLLMNKEGVFQFDKSSITTIERMISHLWSAKYVEFGSVENRSFKLPAGGTWHVFYWAYNHGYTASNAAYKTNLAGGSTVTIDDTTIGHVRWIAWKRV